MAVGLDYSYALMMAEELGTVTCGAIPMASGVQTDMATPALARFGSDHVLEQFLAPAISGDFVACIGVSETRRRLRRRLDQDPGALRWRRLRHQWRQDVDHKRGAGRFHLPAREPAMVRCIATSR
jgi:alkylation response protein AidB-like acyl-CoA dehydrogenase